MQVLSFAKIVDDDDEEEEHLNFVFNCFED